MVMSMDGLRLFCVRVLGWMIFVFGFLMKMDVMIKKMRRMKMMFSMGVMFSLILLLFVDIWFV